MTLGYWLGEDARRIVDSILEYPLYVAIALILAAACYWFFRRKS